MTTTNLSKGGLPICEYALNGDYIRTWKSASAIATIYPVSRRSVWGAANGSLNTLYGRQWRYLSETNRRPIQPAVLSYYVKRVIQDKIRKLEYNYQVVIPDDLLYHYDKNNKEDILLALNDLLESVPDLSQYHQRHLKDAIDFLKKN